MPLTIYKASAGSGKTFRLTQGYLEMLFQDPRSYKHILAVTFTNKAASEMKSRILERLYKLSVIKADESSDDLEHLLKVTGLTRTVVIDRAGSLLVTILNDYSRFSVGTIDRFFQGVIRAFAREVGLPAGFVLELDRDRILGEAVDRLFMDLGEDAELFEWMLKLAQSRIEESRGWNFRGDIMHLGEELFSEAYQQVQLDTRPAVSRDQLHAFMTSLNRIRQKASSEIRETAREMVDRIRSAGYAPDDFQGGSRSLAVLFEKAEAGGGIKFTGPRIKGITDLSRWISRKETDQEKIKLAESVLMPGLAEIYRNYILVRSADETGGNMYSLGILGDIAGKIRGITSEKNLFLLSDAPRFLKGLIGNNPTPFIYEKTGSYIEHIMLDEFQDTSVFQWQNFQPLIAHTLSLGKDNMIVGDVKQSIYRWRNSDWKILAGEVEHAFDGYHFEPQHLDENWRSMERLIRFNNTLFSRARQIILNLVGQEYADAGVSDEFRKRWDGLLDTAYDQVVQKIPGISRGTGGYVRGEIMQPGDAGQQEQALERLPGWIRELQDTGYGAGQTAILVRTNREGAEVAQVLMELSREDPDGKYNYNFVSNQSLFLDQNIAVRFLVSLLGYLRNSGDELNNVGLCYYFRSLFAEPVEDPSEALHPGWSVEEALGTRFTEALPLLKRLPLFELTEHLIRYFGLEKRATDLPYIQAFQEMILELQQDEPGSLHDFLVYWNDHGHKKSVTVSEEQDAIRIITIHKAKGLQFKAVIIPFCNWSLTGHNSGNDAPILWSSTAGTPFETLPVVPLKYKKGLEETLFAEAYLEEKIMTFVDHLNLLYVAFTRAEEVLIAGLPPGRDDGKVKNAGELVIQAVQTAALSADQWGMELSGALDEDGFRIGEMPGSQTTETREEKVWQIHSYPVKIRNERIRLRLRSAEFFKQPEAPGGDHLDFGTLMHEIFRLIITAGDAGGAVEKYLREGMLREAQSEKLLSTIQEKLQDQRVAGWFDGSKKVINERDIIAGGEIYRPDRVMVDKNRAVVVDYKFGDIVLKKYERQVQGYMRLLEEMGYEHVEGYIWYVMTGKITGVD